MIRLSMPAKTTIFSLGLILGIALGGLIGYLIFQREPNVQKDGILQKLEVQQNDAAREIASAPRPAAAENVNIKIAPDDRKNDRKPSVANPEIIIKKETGSGKIFGKVVDSKGVPVSGVALLARTSDSYNYNRTFAPPDETLTIEDVLRDAVKDHENKESRTWRARTRDDGTFIIENLPDRRFDIFARKPGFEIRPKNARYTELRVDVEVVFIALQKMSVPISVKLPNGAPPEECDIRGWRDEGPGRVAVAHRWTPAAASMDLAPGIYQFNATAGDDASGAIYKCEYVEATVQSPPSTIVLQLAAKLTIFGKIQFEDPEETPSAVLYISEHSPENITNPEKLKSTGKVIYGEMEYTVYDVKPGKYDVGVARRRGPMLSIATVEVTDKSVCQNFKMPPRVATEFIIVKVADESGAPVEGIQFEMNGVVDGLHNAERIVSLAKGAGEYWLSLPDGFDGVFTSKSDSPLYLQVKSNIYGTLTIQLAPPKREYKAVFSNPAILNIKVIQNQSSAIDGVLYARVRNSAGFGFAPKQILDGGIARLDALMAGNYQIELYISCPGATSGYENIMISAAQATLSPGQNNIQIDAPAVQKFILKIPEAKPGEEVELARINSKSPFNALRLSVGAGSAVQYKNIPDGDYVITYYHPSGAQKMNLHIPAGPEIIFQPY